MTVTDGEQDHPIDEMQAVYRTRLFVEHHGEDTEYTAEIRLPPEVRAKIRDHEEDLDEARRRRLRTEALRRVFRKRGSILKLFRGYTLVVDRKQDAVFELRRGRDHLLFKLEDVYRADVEGIGERPDCRVVVELTDGTEDHPVGKVHWSEGDAVEIAEAINDGIDLSESLRKLLRYRRVARDRERERKAGP
jgi:hypothetical protein